MRKFLLTILFLFSSLFIASSVHAVTEFTSVIDPGQGTGYDFADLATWEAVTQVDLTSAATRVFSHATMVGTIPDGSTLVGTSSGAVASTTRVTATQILLYNISGTFQSGEKLYIQGAGTDNNYVYLTNAGDSAIAVAKCRTTDGSFDASMVTVDGWTTNATNYVKIWTDPSEGYRHDGRVDGGGYTMKSSNGTDYLWNIQVVESYTVVDGIKIIRTSANWGYGHAVLIEDTFVSPGNYATISNCLLIQESGGAGALSSLLRMGQSATNGYGSRIYNNIFISYSDSLRYGLYTGQAYSAVAERQAFIYNNTIYGSYITAALGVNMTNVASDTYISSIRNNYIVNTNPTTSVPDVVWTGSFGTSSTQFAYNATDDGTGGILNNNQQITLAQAGFNYTAATSSLDLHLGSASALLNQGTSSLKWTVGNFYDIDGTARGGAFDIGADEVAMDFVSTICEDAARGGDCANMDYSRLYDWEASVDSDLTASTTRVFSGVRTGTLSNGNSLDVYVDGADTGINVVVVASTSDQILVRSITGTTTPLIVTSGTQFRYTGGTTNMWTVVGTGDALGASPVAVGKIDGGWVNADTQNIFVNGWTTDTDNYIRVYADSAARHSGKWNNTKYRLSYTPATAYQSAIDTREDFIRFEGLQIEARSNGLDDVRGIVVAYVSQKSDVRVSENIVRGVLDTYGYGVLMADDDGLVRVFNNIIYNFSGPTGGSGIYSYSGNLRAYNNTIYNSSKGIERAGGNLIAINNLIASTSNPFDGTFAAGTRYNATNGSDTPSGGTNTITNASFDFFSTVSGTEDFHIGYNSAAWNSGVNLASDPNLYFTTDVDGALRNSDSRGWDIGVDETPTKIYRSTGYGRTAPLVCGGGSNNLNVSSTTALGTFDSSLLDNIGVGDAVVYNASSSILFIHGRTSNTVYTLRTVSGANPPDVVNDSGWCIYRAYTSLSNSESGMENIGIPSVVRNFDNWLAGDDAMQDDLGKNLITSGEQWNVAFYADAVNSAVIYISQWVASNDYYLRFYTPFNSNEVGISQRHSGVWDGTKATISQSGTPITSVVEYTRIEGLQIEDTGSDGYGAIMTNGPYYQKGLYIYNNIIRCVGTCSDAVQQGISFSSVAGVAEVKNNIIYGFNNSGGSAAMRFNELYAIYRQDGRYSVIANNTVYGNYYGIRLYGNAGQLYNNISNNNPGGDYTGTPAASGNNISSDATSPDTAFRNKTVQFVNPYSYDFHLSRTDTSAVDTGTSSLSSNIYLSFTDDVDGNKRRPVSGNGWDIGADESAVDFVSSVMQSGGDFSTLASWEAANQVNLVSPRTAVYSCSVATGSIPVGATIVGTSTGATASTTVMATSSKQILLYNITASSTGLEFISGEKVYILGGSTNSNYCILSDNGNPAIVNAKIDGAWTVTDTNAVDIDGWVTGAGNYVKIYTTDLARHIGKAGTTNYRMRSSIDYFFAVNEEYTDVSGIELDSNNSFGILVYANGTKIHHNVIYKFGGYNGAGIRVNYLSGLAYVYDNIIYNGNPEGNAGAIYCGGEYATTYVYNNTVYNVGYNGIVAAPNAQNRVIAVNNAVASSTDSFNGTFIAGTMNNATDGTDTPAGGTNTFTNVNFNFLNTAVGGEDLHIASGSGAQNLGLNLFSTSTLAFTTDIDGTSRGATWDIGADEVPVDFVSTICESTTAGGDCANLDYRRLYDWEDKVESDITASTTRVFSGSLTGALSENNLVYLLNTSGVSVARGYIVATTSDQILIDGIVGSTTLPVIAGANYTWRRDVSNYWTVSGFGDALGASPVAVGKIDGGWVSADTQDISVNGWTTDVDNYVKIYTTQTARHSGKWSDAKYRLVYSATGSYVSALNITEGYTEIDGLQIRLSNPSGYSFPRAIQAVYVNNQSSIVIKNNVIDYGDDGNGADGITLNDIGGTSLVAFIYNNIITDFEAKGVANYSQTAHVYNNSFYNCNDGISAGGTTFAKNNLVASTTNPFVGTFAAGTMYNATDGTDTPTGGTNTITNAIFDFVSTASGTEDFHIGENSAAKNTGISLSATSTLSFNTDIDGGLRNADGLGWDIGADEVATKIYRSVGNIDTAISNAATVTISGQTATFSADQSDNIGVGDVIQYGGAGYYQLAFITARASSTQYSVQSYDGSLPSATTTAAMNIYRAYLELNDWETNTEASVNSGIDSSVDQLVPVSLDLVSSNAIMMVPCYASGAGDDAAVVVSGWTTGDQNYIKIYTPVSSVETGVSQRHSGKEGTGYKIAVVNNDAPLDLRVGYVYIDGIEVDNSNNINTTAVGIRIYNNALGDVYISNSILHASSTSFDSTRGISNNSDNAVVYFFNNIIYDVSRGFSDSYPNLAVYSYNNTIVDVQHGLFVAIGATNKYLKNNIVYRPTIEAYRGAYDSSSNNNLSSTADTTGGSNDKSNAVVAFMDEQNNNFHLALDDTAALNAGTSTLATIHNSQLTLNYDIDGNYRRTWDIGADEGSVDFVSTVMQSGGDFSTLASWETANQVDLTAFDTAVYSCSVVNGFMPINSTVVGTSSGATANTTVMATSSKQILLYNITASSTGSEFIAGEKVYIQGSSDTANYCILSDAGNPASAVAKIDGTWTVADTNAVDIYGWTTGANNFINIYTTNAARHTGKYDTSKYRIDAQENGYFRNLIRQSYTVVDGLQFKSYNEGFVTIGYPGTPARKVTVKNSLFKGTLNGYYEHGLYTFENGLTDYHIFNNIFYDFQGSAINSVWQYGYIYNNTFNNCGIGVDPVGSASVNTPIIVNNIFSNCAIPITNSSSYGSDYNITDSASLNYTVYGGGNTHDKVSQVILFANEVGDDFHLSPSDTAARNAGIALWSNATSSFTTDIDGTSRGVAWDIGADEVPVDFVSTICESTTAGGDCVNLDYRRLYDWENGVESDLTASTTRVFSGSLTGALSENNLVYLFNNSGVSIARGYVVATTSDQILIDGIVGSTTLPVIAEANYVWRYNVSNYWTVSGAGDALGASPVAIGKIDGRWTSPDTTDVAVDGWVTDKDNYIQIYTTAAARHNGKAHSNYYLNNAYIHIYENYLRLYGVEVGDRDVNGVANWGLGLITLEVPVSTESEVYIGHNIVHGVIRPYGMGIEVRRGSAMIFNNIVYDIQGSGIISDSAQRNYIYNNTVYGANKEDDIYRAGIRDVSKNSVVINNLSVNNGINNVNDFCDISGDCNSSTFVAGSGYNISSDVSAPGSDNITNAVINFISKSSGSYDFHLNNLDTIAVNAGVNLSVTSTLSFNTDIDGGLRNADGLGWDIGADEVATKIYRSVGNINTAISNAATVTISGQTAVFSAAQPDNIGVGDVIQYGGTGYYQLAFITARASSAQYSVQSYDGSLPSATTTAAMNIYRAYLELNDWETNTEASVNSGIDSSVDQLVPVSLDLVSSNAIMMVPCYASGAGDNAAVNINSWTSSEQNYIKIYTPVASNEVGVSQRHGGKWDDGKYRIELLATNGFQRVISISGNNATKIDGLQISVDNVGHSYSGGIAYEDSHYQYISNNIIQSVSHGTGEYEFGITSSNSAAANIDQTYIWNNIIYDFISPGGMGIYAAWTEGGHVYNNTIHHCQTGLGGNASNYLAKNNIVYGSLTVDYENADFRSGSTNNLSSDGSADDDSDMANSKVNQVVKFVDADFGNFHLAPDDTTARNAGTSTLSTINNSQLTLNYDIDGNYRRTWDIGADEGSVDFVSTVMQSGGDFSTLASWETANQVDLTAFDTAVYSCSVVDGFMPTNSTVVGTSSGATASTTVMATSSKQILLYNITASSTGSEFIAGEKVYIQGGSTNSNYCILSDVGNPANAVAKIDGAWTVADTNAVDIYGWTTGPNNYIKVYTTSQARHLGKWGDGYRIHRSSLSQYHLNIAEGYVWVDGLSMSGNGRAVFLNNPTMSGDVVVSNCFGEYTGIDGFDVFDIYTVGDVNWILYNNIGITNSPNISSEAFFFNDVSSAIVAYNNTAIANGGHAFRGEANFGNLVNNIGKSNSGQDYYLDANFVSVNCISSDESSDDGAGFGNIVSAQVKFANESAGDFHLSSDDVVARNAGYYASSNGISTDIDGTSRGAAWDIGADEVPVDFVSTICESTTAGGDCEDLDYNSLFTWEDKVETDLTASTTRVFSGSLTGSISENDLVYLLNNSGVSVASGRVVATTSDQILIDGIVGSTTLPVIAEANYVWRRDVSNYWTVLGVNDELGASPVAISKIDGAWTAPETQEISIYGWNTDNDNYIKVYTTELARHKGIWDSSKYSMEKNNSIMRISEGFVRIDGLQFHNTTAADWGISIDSAGLLTGRADIEISNSIIRHDHTTGSNNRGIDLRTDTPGSIARIFNNIIYGINTDTSLHFQDSDFTYYVYNNTIFDCNNGMLVTEGSVVAKNNLIASTTNPFQGTFAAGTNFNSTDNSDTPGAGTNNFTNQTFTFVSTTTEDFHLASNDTGAKNKGVSLEFDSKLSFNTDIDGEIRHILWDIGADQEYGGGQQVSIKQDALFDGLVAYWNFNEGSGTAVKDISGNGNDGVWSGAGKRWTGYGRYGNSGVFNETVGNTDHVDFSSPSSLDDLSSFSYSTWVYATDLLDTVNPVIEKGSGSSVRKTLRYTAASGGSQRKITASVDFDGTDAYAESVVDTYSLNTWDHVVATYDGTSRLLRIFVNGVEVSYSVQTAGVGAMVSDATDELWIGTTPVTNFYDFNGKIDETRIYNRTLSQREISLLHNGGRATLDWNFRNDYKDNGTICGVDGKNCRELIAGGSGNQFGGGYLEESTTALILNGSGYAYRADDAHLDIASTSDFSLVATFKTSSNSTMVLAAKKTDLTAGTSGYSLNIDAGAGDGIVHFVASDGANQFTVTSNKIINDDKWHTVALVFDENDNNGNKIYIDGVDATGSQAGSLTALGTLVNNTDFTVGRSGSAANYFTGAIDRVAFFPYALEKDEVLRENSAGYDIRAGHRPQNTNSNAQWDPFGGAAPVAWWKLDETEGSVAANYISGALNGTWYGSGNHHQNGKIGMGGYFNGVDDYIDFGDVNEVEGMGAITVSAWFKANEIAVDQRIVAKSGDWPFSWLLSTDDGVADRITWALVVGGSAEICDSTATYEIGKWYHVVGTWDGTDCQLYVNNIVSGPTSEGGTGNIINVDNSLTIGSEDGIMISEHMNGTIDDVRIYNYVRSQSQLMWDYDGGAPVAHIKFDEGTSGSADGQNFVNSGSGINGTGDDGSNNTGLARVAGRNGGAVDFDGADDWVAFGDDPRLDNMPEMTVCAWVQEQNCGETYGIFVGKSGDSYSGWNLYTRCSGIGGGFGFSYWQNSSVGIWRDNRNFDLTPNEWYHLCATYDGQASANGITLYANGVAITYTNQDTDGGFVRDDSVNNLQIGSRAGGDYAFGGLVDDVRVYNYIRTPEQIKEDYSGGRVKF